ncbi:Anthranilate synthase alpha subunit 2, chloroplastic [Turnera subulata]|uniref:Anthranilate synthase alpha subunit 2, chloroplastic n=1 Tax=Turnera subulata TaxID=218843 RepID=A0A9Q0FN97_9ROSI|nr:Anthranilate synthase alpha subunit 2, chloroplastic [Turnera subulata]
MRLVNRQTPLQESFSVNKKKRNTRSKKFQFSSFNCLSPDPMEACLLPTSLPNSTLSLTMDKTLAVTPRHLPLSPPIPAAIKLDGRFLATPRAASRPPLALACANFSRARSVQCSASSAKSSVDKATFEEAAGKGNLVPIFRCIFSDHLTPVLAYRCLVREDDRDAPSFLFESVEPGLNASTIGRYSVIGAQPSIEIVAKENMVTIMDHYEGTREEVIVDDPMTVPRRIMEGWNPQLIDELPEVFCGGWVGYFSYDTVRYVETKKLPFSSAPPDDRNLPDVHLGLYEDVIVFDHVEKKAYVIHWVRLDRFSSVDEAYFDGVRRLQNLVSRVHDIAPPRLLAGTIDLSTRLFGSKLDMSTITSDAFKDVVLTAKEHILAGDIFQIVLSQRFERRTFADPFEIYRSLRIVNPSPYMTYLQARGCILVASSPEILTRVKKRKITNRPLAGTCRRGKTPKEDAMLEKELLNDEKQCAEHIMLVDLGRNDVGKVSKPGSVKVEKLMNVERYSHVTGELLDDLTSWDALRAALPVGTVSGAPKVKAMELIDQLEATRRGPYSGGFGGISFSGDMDIALALRTIVFPSYTHYNTMYSYDYKDANKRREWVAHLQAGAGIVADSDPADEQRECENKAAALARAIDLADYYSLHGHVETMARQIQRGANTVQGVEATLWQVAETLPSLVLQKVKAPPKADDVPVIQPDQLLEADGFLFGFPSRYGVMAAQFKAFFDATHEIWATQALAGKPAGIFWSTGYYGGGQELTALTAITQLAHHGMLFVPLGYTFGSGMFEMDEVKGGSSYGAGTFAADGTRQPTELELQQAFYQGKYVAEITKKLKCQPN